MNHTKSGLVHLCQDKALQHVIAQIDLPELNASGDVYFDLIESIVSQQISIHAARAIFARFCALFPENYPHAGMLIDLPMEQLRAAGLSGQKASYIQNIARYSLEQNLEDKNWSDMSDEEIIQLLTAIKGVGRWTVEMVLIFTLERTDVLPVDDLGIRQAFSKLFGIQGTGKAFAKEMAVIAEPWRPWRSLACRYLWRWNSLSTNPAT